MKQVGHQPIYWLFIAITFTIFGIGINSGTPIQANQIPPAMQTHGVSRNGHSISEKATVKLINQAPDMDPDRTILTLKPADYKTNEKLFDTAYNVFSFSPRVMFKKHTATIYVADHQLRPLTKAAIQKWNTALKFPVFKMGTSKTQTLSIRFTSTAADNWDGLYNGKTILIAKNHFKDPKYPVAYIKPSLAAKMSTSQYWTGVIAHELGHTLGLDHTAYQADLMYAANSEGNVVAKYHWSHPIERSSSGLDGTEMARISQRDLHRAQLTKQLGYW